MNIQALMIGNELLNGKIQDKNAQFLAREIFSSGLKLSQVSLIQDDPKHFNNIFKLALESSQIIILSGGLGPTKDDLTKAMLADFFSLKSFEDSDALKIVEEHYTRASRQYDKSNLSYHIMPEGLQALANPVGFAPGLFYQWQDKMIFALPGVPAEFNAMVKESVIPLIQKNNSTTQLRENIIVKTWKQREADIFHKLSPELWNKLAKFGIVSSLPHALGVDIGVEISVDNKQKLNEIKEKVLSEIKTSSLANYIWHIGPESLEEVIINEAKAKGLTFGFAESCTGGLLASRITDISGCSDVFMGGVVSYANQVKRQALEVKSQTLDRFGAVSLETAQEMARGARKILGADLVISTSGIAGPSGGSKEKPIGTVAIGIASAHKNTSKMYYFSGDRIQLKQRFSQQALFSLLQLIREQV